MTYLYLQCTVFMYLFEFYSAVAVTLFPFYHNSASNKKSFSYLDIIVQSTLLSSFFSNRNYVASLITTIFCKLNVKHLIFFSQPEFMNHSYLLTLTANLVAVNVRKLQLHKRGNYSAIKHLP